MAKSYLHLALAEWALLETQLASGTTPAAIRSGRQRRYLG